MARKNNQASRTTKPTPTTPAARADRADPTVDAVDIVPPMDPPPAPPAEEPPADAAPAVRRPADEAPAETKREPGIDVLRKIDFSQTPGGYVQRTPSPALSPEEAYAQAHLFAELLKQGVPLQDQGGVYPWLLRQVMREVEDRRH